MNLDKKYKVDAITSRDKHKLALSVINLREDGYLEATDGKGAA